MGTATRPINIFYGLSQGSRAIAAAYAPEKEWRLYGHGIQHEGSLDRAIERVAVRNSAEERGSFTALARLLRSPSLPARTEVGALLAALPLEVPSASWTGRPPALIVQHANQAGGAVLTMTRYVRAETGPWPLSAPLLSETNLDRRRDIVVKYIETHYPSLTGATPFPEGAAWHRTDERGSYFCLDFDAGSSTGSDSLRAQLLHSRLHKLGTLHYAIPALAGNERAAHPLIGFWSVLWVFSMLARYEPVRWSKLLDVDHSADATALEEILKDALDVVPWLLLDALNGAPT